ncbi:MAG: hypothetical protein DBX47_02200 [Clostridiales bacterium]|nr:MAG: hypothetical protein DBX47_02200 [Clostridiales bacterium]
MKFKNILIQITERLHYLFLAVFTIALNVRSFSVLSEFMTGVTIIYIIGFEFYLFLRRRNTKALSATVVSMLNMTSQKRLIDFPIPIIVTDNEGELLWYNDKLLLDVGSESVNKLGSVFELNSNILSQRETKVFFGHKNFIVYSDCSILGGKEMYLLYFIDNTEYRTLQKKYNDSRAIVSIILIDNYEELFQNARDNERTSAMAMIENTLNEWGQSVGGLVRKIEKDRYLFIFKNEDLISFTEKRFPIIDKIRNLQLPELSASATVSIGIGAQNCNFSQNEELARQALDMALSRGGDQAVVKTETDFEFYGGRTKGMEKRSKVKSRMAAMALKELLRDVDNVLIMGHKYSDFDSLGASVGLSRIAVAAGKKTGIIFDQKTSLAMPLYERLIKNSIIAERFVDAEKALVMAGPNCLVIVVDTHRAGYSIMPSVLEYAGKIMVVDHHRKSADFIENANVFYHEPYASSACEMVSEIMQYMNISRMPQLEAEAVLAGIYLDTKSFTLRTNPHTFEASSFLRKAGADTVNVKQLFQIDMQTYMCRAELIKNAIVYKKVIAISVWNGDNVPNVRMAAAQAADELLNIENVKASFTLFCDRDGVVNISGRSFGMINVQLVLEKLQGGGHQTMAGAQLSGTTLEKAKEQLISAINTYLGENLQDSESLNA